MTTSFNTSVNLSLSNQANSSDAGALLVREALEKSQVMNFLADHLTDSRDPARYPKFKRKHGKQSSYHCTSVSAGENWIKIPKMEPIKARIHRKVEGQYHPCLSDRDRDVNAALNIRAQGILKLKAAGLSVSATGDQRQSGHAPVAA
ncbi:hypothetical protein [Marinospirillum sp.]|uniref:hypothetical protein n=1 Tax=Marinospirillum sp. TaxID=2183934 RepID=UPI0025BEC5F0|nr:hypothetical protein [Marinospirillum sp.]